MFTGEAQDIIDALDEDEELDESNQEEYEPDEPIQRGNFQDNAGLMFADRQGSLFVPDHDDEDATPSEDGSVLPSIT